MSKLIGKWIADTAIASNHLANSAKESVLQYRVRAHRRGVLTFSTSAASSDTVTTEVLAAATTDTPQTSLTAKGIYTGTVSGANDVKKVLIRQAGTDNGIDDGNNDEIYGVLTEATGVYTLSYKKADGTAFTFSATDDIDYYFVEISDLDDLPTDALLYQSVGGVIDSGQAATLAGHLDGTSNKHDATEIDVETAGNYTTVSDLETNLGALDTAIGNNDTDIGDLVTLSGVAVNSTNLGTFTGSTIGDNVTVKAALQALETEVELKASTTVVSEIDQNVDDLITLSGVAENATNLGTFTGSTIVDSSTIKAALQALETQVDTNATHATGDGSDHQDVVDLVTLSGVAANSANLGTFTGSTISDNQTVKAALQDLETQVDSNITAIGLNTTHRTSDGSDHTFIDQDVTSGSSPTFNGSNISGIITGNVDTTHVLVVKSTAGTIAAGKPVYAVGWDGVNGAITVEEADASDPAKMPAIGITEVAITNTFASTYFATITGNLSGIDTSGFSVGDQLYVASGGGLTATKPTGTNLIQKVGEVTNSNASGNLVITGAGRTNDIPNIPSNNFWLGDGSGVATATNFDTEVSANSDVSAASTHATGDGSDHQDVIDLVTLSGVAANSTDLGTFTGATIADSSTIKAALQAVETAYESTLGSFDNLVTLTGVAEDSTDLGSFTGATIANNQTIKAALQDIETAYEETDVNVNDLITLSGVAENASDLGTFTGSTIADSSTIKVALQAIETAYEETDANVDDLVTLSGVAENSSDLGTFTGTTIPDSQTVKQALQALETSLESQSSETAGFDAFTLTGTDITNKYVDLTSVPKTATAVRLFAIGGPLQDYGVDFAIITDGSENKRLTWAASDPGVSVGLESVLASSDKLKVYYEVA